MGEWKECKIGDVCKSISDTYRGNAEEVVLVNTSDVLDGKCLNHTKTPNRDLKGQFKKTFQKDDILYSEIRPANKRFAYIDFDAVDYIASTKLMVIRCNKEILPQYLFYILTNKSTIEELQVIAESRSGTFPQITFSEVANLDIDLPSIDEQKEILSILKSLDDKIENNRKINENLEQQAQALFKSWFVDFEPFRDQPFVDSELGMIPEGWRVYCLPEIVDIYSGYSYKGSELKESKDAMATIKNFDRAGGFRIDGYKEIELSERVKDTQYLELFDVVVAHTDLTQNADIIGNPVLILNKSGYNKIIISMDLCKVVPNNSYISNTLLFCLLNDSRFKQHALGYVNGTTVLHLNKKALPDYKVTLPSNLSELLEIDKAFDSIYNIISRNIKESQHLVTLRDTLLPRLMSGELKVN